MDDWELTIGDTTITMDDSEVTMDDTALTICDTSLTKADVKLKPPKGYVWEKDKRTVVPQNMTEYIKFIVDRVSNQKWQEVYKLIDEAVNFAEKQGPRYKAKNAEVKIVVYLVAIWVKSEREQELDESEEKALNHLFTLLVFLSPLFSQQFGGKNSVLGSMEWKELCRKVGLTE